MCGIVGFMTTEKEKGKGARMDFFAQGLIVDILRGKDSTGVLYGYHMAPDVRAGWLKDKVDGFRFVTSEAYREHLIRPKNPLRFAVGHNRAATLGSVSTKNAHPFAHEHVIGIHNGTVRGGMIDMPLPMYRNGFQVDSDCLMANLNHVDPDDADSAVLAKIDGAYMLVWYDKRDGTLNFARNDTRSFHLAQSYEQDTIFFASEAGELQWLCDRNGVGTSDVYYLKPMHHLKFNDERGLVPAITEVPERPKSQWPVPATTPAANTSTSTGQAPSAASGTTNGSNGLGKPIAPRYYGSLDNRVEVGGRKREVPALMRQELKALGIAPEDRLCFKPMMRQGEPTLWTPTAPRYVAGYLDSLDCMGVAYRTEQLVAENAFERPWTVRPVGVYWTDEERTAPMVVLEIVRTESDGSESFSLRRDKQTRPESSPSSSTKDSDQTNPDGLPGPDGSLLSMEDWLEATSRGCVSCGMGVDVSDAEDLRWDLVSGEPQCGDCAAADDEALARLHRDEVGDYYGLV